MFFSGANYTKFWEECKECYRDYFIPDDKIKIVCKDGNISKNKEYIGKFNDKTNRKCKVLGIPFTKEEVTDFLDLCDNIIQRNNTINYDEFCKMTGCSDEDGLCDYSEIIIDGLFYSGVYCSDYWNRIPKEFVEKELDDYYSSSDADESNEVTQSPKRSIYDYLPQIFEKLGYK